VPKIAATDDMAFRLRDGSITREIRYVPFGRDRFCYQDELSAGRSHFALPGFVFRRKRTALSRNERHGGDDRMEYRVLGKTGWKVSVVGFGASPLGGVFGEIEEAEGIRAVHTARELGINLFDVAPYYGLTKAETVLGKALATLPRDSFYLSSKVGRYGAEVFDFSSERVVRSVEESLTRLRTDYLDLVLCHDIEYGSLTQIIEETLPALRELQAQGRVSAVGISGLPLKIFSAVLDSTELDVILSYCHYTLYDTTLAGLLPMLKARQVGVISAAPLGMGLLSGGEIPAWHPAPEALRAACARATELCRQRGADIARLALQFALANSDIATTLIGMKSAEEVRRNVTCVGSPPAPELLSEVQSLFATVHPLTWQTGRPENN
jgi:L-galactose dehydrogenase